MPFFWSENGFRARMNDIKSGIWISGGNAMCRFLLDAMICCTIFAIGLQKTVAMRRVDFLDAMIVCKIFAIGLPTTAAVCN